MIDERRICRRRRCASLADIQATSVLNIACMVTALESLAFSHEPPPLCLTRERTSPSYYFAASRRKRWKIFRLR